MTAVLFFMEYRQLGHSGVQVSCVSLGSWLTYEFIPEEDALAVIASGIEAGINFLDDARYNDRTGHAPLKTGYSEVLFGRLLRKGGWKRSDLVLANKLWYEFYPQQSAAQELDSSLERLQLDYLDLVYCEKPPVGLALVEMVKQMDELIKAGKVRYWGVLNWTVTQLEEAVQVARKEGFSAPCAAELLYSLLHRSLVENEHTQTFFRGAGIGVVASYSLHGGLLSGKYLPPDAAAKKRFGEKELDAMQKQGLFEKVKRVTELAHELECTPAQLSLAYCLKNDLVSSLLFGATSVTQVQENVRTLEILPRLTPEVMEKLRSI